MKALWGFAGIAAVLLLWEWGHRSYGPLILPGLDDTAAALGRLACEGRLLPALGQTALHAAAGWTLGTLAGTLAGIGAGRVEALRHALQPLAMMLLGIPAIAWVVLALMWFGGGRAVVFTVAVAVAPLVFAAAQEGVRSLDGPLARMARVFQVPPATRLINVHGPVLLSHLVPVLATSFALSWKVAVMAELLSGAGGIGDGLGTARAQVDTAAIMAWVVVVAGLLLVVDLVVLRPLQHRMWAWRDSGKTGP